MELINRFIKVRGERADNIQIKEWIRQAQYGDMRARNFVIEHNLELVIREAFRIRTKVDDIFQQGIFGLIRAIELFNLSSGNQFSTYATPWIRSFMQRYLNDTKCQIRKPTYLDEIHRKYFKLVSEFPRETREFYIKKLKESMGKKSVNIKNALKFIDDEYCSKDGMESAYDGESIDFGIVEEELLDCKYNMFDMDGILSVLDRRSALVVKYRYQGWTYRTIGREFDISHEMVRQIFNKAMVELKAIIWAMDRGFIVKPKKTIEKMKGRK